MSTEAVPSSAGGAIVAKALLDQGVRRVFCLAGGHIAPILVEAKALGIRVIDVRDEKNAAFAADATGRLTGVPGVAVVTAGPGVTNTLTALQNAMLAQSPLVLLGGAAPTMLQGKGALQDIDQIAVVKPHVKWSFKVSARSELSGAIEKAFRMAKTGTPGPVFVECPIDILFDEALVRSWFQSSKDKQPSSLGQSALQWYLSRHLDKVFEPGTKAPSLVERIGGAIPELRPADTFPSVAAPLLNRAVKMMKEAERPVFLVGSQAVRSPEIAKEVAASLSDLDAPVYLAGMARGLLGKNHPNQIRHKRREALKEADLVVLCGVPADFRLDYGRAISGKAKVISANLETGTVLKNRIPTLPIPVDPAQFIIRLSGAIGERKGWYDAWLGTLKDRDGKRDAEIERLSLQDAKSRREDGSHLVNPIALCRAIDRWMADDAVIAADGGDFVATAAYTLRPRKPLGWLDPGPFGTLGVGAGFALASALQHPERETWLLYGDGAAGFSLVEFDAFVRHGASCIAVVGNDAGWTQIERDQVELLNDDVSCRLAYTRYDKVAEGYGAVGFHMTAIDQADAIFQEAKTAAARGKPVVINVELGKSDFRKGSISM